MSCSPTASATAVPFPFTLRSIALLPSLPTTTRTGASRVGLQSNEGTVISSVVADYTVGTVIVFVQLTRWKRDRRLRIA